MRSIRSHLMAIHRVHSLTSPKSTLGWVGEAMGSDMRAAIDAKEYTMHSAADGYWLLRHVEGHAGKMRLRCLVFFHLWDGNRTFAAFRKWHRDTWGSFPSKVSADTFYDDIRMAETIWRAGQALLASGSRSPQ